MELKDRIQQIMNREKVSASVFADSIGVQRSSISHIISGRNKPSLEFVQKILSSYPKYKAEWLIMGIGNIDTLNTPETPNKSTFKASSEDSKDLFNSPTISDKQAESIISEPVKSTSINEIPVHPKQESIIKSVESTVNKGNKAIEKIVIFYSDKTFDVYNTNI